MAPTCRKEVTQCKTCPWRVGSDVANIPRYRRDLHEKLRDTIRSDTESMTGALRVMSCHYSQETEIPCAGWLENQIGPGNNIGVRIAVMVGRLPVPKTTGEQHESFEDTLRIFPR